MRLVAWWLGTVIGAADGENLTVLVADFGDLREEQLHVEGRAEKGRLGELFFSKLLLVRQSRPIPNCNPSDHLFF
jgi:hypothetical protein